MFHSTWGHAITDSMRLLWFLKSEAFKRDFKDCPLVYLICKKNIIFSLDSYPNFRRLLEILEIDVDRIQEITQPTRFDKIIFPDVSFFPSPNRIFTNEYFETIERVRSFALKNRTPISSKKVYYFYGNRGLGEKRLAEYFKLKGYDVVSPEKLTLDEQLNILINVESFAATLGSISHNCLFLRDYTETIIIPRSPLFTLYQQVIDEVRQLKTNYIDTTLSIFSNGWAPNCFIISKQLREFFNDNFDGYDEDDFKIFLQYVKNYVTEYFNFLPKNKNYYAPVLSEFMEQLKQREDLIAAYNMPPNWEEFRPSLSYQVHVHKKGWGEWNNENQISNPLDQKLDIQAITLRYPNFPHKIYYSVYYNEEEGWSEEVLAPKMAGTTGKAKAIMGLKIRLDDAGTKEFDILYRIHKFDDTWSPWAKNGETIYSQGVKINAIQIKMEDKKTQ